MNKVCICEVCLKFRVVKTEEEFRLRVIEHWKRNHPDLWTALFFNSQQNLFSENQKKPLD